MKGLIQRALAGTETNSIVSSISDLLDSDNFYKKMIPVTNPYGDGKASGKIVKIIYNFFK